MKKALIAALGSTVLVGGFLTSMQPAMASASAFGDGAPSENDSWGMCSTAEQQFCIESASFGGESIGDGVSGNGAAVRILSVGNDWTPASINWAIYGPATTPTWGNNSAGDTSLDIRLGSTFNPRYTVAYSDGLDINITTDGATGNKTMHIRGKATEVNWKSGDGFTCQLDNCGTDETQANQGGTGADAGGFVFSGNTQDMSTWGDEAIERFGGMYIATNAQATAPTVGYSLADVDDGVPEPTPTDPNPTDPNNPPSQDPTQEPSQEPSQAPSDPNSQEPSQEPSQAPSDPNSQSPSVDPNDPGQKEPNVGNQSIIQVPQWSFQVANPHLGVSGEAATGSFTAYLPKNYFDSTGLAAISTEFEVIRRDGTGGSAINTPLTGITSVDPSGGAKLRINSLHYSSPTLLVRSRSNATPPSPSPSPSSSPSPTPSPSPSQPTPAASKPGKVGKITSTKKRAKSLITWAAPAVTGGATVDSYRISITRTWVTTKIVKKGKKKIKVKVTHKSVVFKRDQLVRSILLSTPTGTYTATISAHNRVGWGSAKSLTFKR